MRIDASEPPSPGEYFRFTVRDGIGETQVEVLVNDTLIHSAGCPDPPCHDLVMVPPYASGQLVVVAVDSQGVRGQRVFNIISRTNPGGMMRAG